MNNCNRRPKLRIMDDDQFRKLLDYFNFSWSGYRKVRKGVKKRISRHMQELKCSNTATYLDLLHKSAAVRQECERRMTVSISRFFRDHNLWLGLEEGILPGIIQTNKKAIRVWSAGCARGEEVYSLKIVWDRLRGKCPHQVQLAIIATDVNPDAIEKARAGIYGKSSLKEVPREIQQRYFDIRKSGTRFELKTFLREGIDWKVQDMFMEPPGSGFDIIFLRNNLLTYYNDSFKEKGLTRVARALAPGGWLIVGSHEKMPTGGSNFRRHPCIPWAYRQEGKN